MKFARLGPAGSETPVAITADGTFDISPVADEIDGSFFSSGGPARVAAALETGSLAVLAEADSLRIGSPIAKPGAVICIGMNYAAHAAESGAEPPTSPVIFFKTPNTVVGPNDDVAIPRKSTKTDWEVELGVVIGATATYLDSPAESASCIAGFVTANDVSEREFQIELSGGQWSKGKCAPGFNPTGPWLVTPDDISSSGLRLVSFVNGEPRQDSTTADLIFDVDYIVWYLRQFMQLGPGDLILTGTPAGVALSGRFPYLKADDIVEIEVEGLGRQRQRFVDA